MSLTRATLEALDRTDPLAHFRDLFALPEGVVYLDGNSLGARPRATAARVAAVVEREWGEGLIRSWNDAGWMNLPARVGDKIGRLVGAPAGSVMVGDSTSVNLFKMLGVALALRPDRRVIVSERRNFPTDLYVAEGLAALLAQGHTLRLVEPEELPHAIDDRVAVVMLTHVNYHTGAMHDMAALTRRAHAAGALALWDLAHSAGAVPVDLTAAGADLAVGCGYKYLNGGPGAPAFLYVAPALQERARYPITGWLGHAAPFAFEPSYRPAGGIARALVGTPPVLSLAALEVGVDIALQAPMDQLRAKSLRQTALFAELVGQECREWEFHLVSPTDPAHRGSQVSLAHPRAYAIMQALIARGVIGDFRAPNILRFGMTPLYLRHAELWDAVQALRAVMQDGEWERPEYQARRAVT
ncbi:MAG: kynureninase [Rhodospirillales bacterium 70-18]|nr:MAG: kynureninase [Rhodospirillales bacterium 70-18]